MVTKQISQKQEDGSVITLDIGAEAVNIETDSEHQFVTAAEKSAISSGSEAAQSASDKIGATGDTGGSTSAGTVMGKLNKIISDLATHISAWSSTRAGYIDNIKSDVAANKTTAAEIKANTDKIGAAEDTGGSTTAGSIFGKLNKLISDLATHMGRWTNTRAVYIDSINTYTATNNTASPTGTLSQKLSHVISLLGNKGAVKSAQRGLGTMSVTVTRTGTSSSSVTLNDLEIAISTVNPDKCIVILDGVAFINSSGDATPFVVNLTSTLLTVSASRTGNHEGTGIVGAEGVYLSTVQISWQVIEFY